MIYLRAFELLNSKCSCALPGKKNISFGHGGAKVKKPGPKHHRPRKKQHTCTSEQHANMWANWAKCDIEVVYDVAA